ncbi:cytochrome c biogenesis protein CcdA [Mumia flava]|uniref:Cytochrome c biogenesis protein CcdA n=1 Tax=Mumia flava TaxID=1348852 RepID=A0A0B2BTH9_9ACTN|nr:cytochrome c biogenesis protein CcdA [Mumia flava]PJJ57999.1 cytochrome c biogenesis protein CcdA [Mumia flava]
MDEIALALAAGSLAAFNPCGFALLPSYLGLLLAGTGGPWRALRLTTAMTAGFVTVFGAFGLALTLVAVPLQQYLPWATVVIGIVLVGLGIWLLTGRELLVRVPRIGAGAGTLSFVALYGYGVSYAVASLSCTVGPFLAVTGIATSHGTFASSVATFVAYAAGMGIVVGVLSVAVVLARDGLVTRLRRVLPYVSRASGALLVLAGAYVAYYGIYELRVYDGGSADDPVVGAATSIQGAISGWIDDAGVWPFAVALALLVAGTLVVVRTRRRRA